MKKLALLLLAALPAAAHDFWIEPSTFRPVAGARFAVALRVGEDFAGDPVPRLPQRIESFTIRDASGERAIAGIENRDPAGFTMVEAEGAATIGYRSNFASLELPREKFETYLAEEGAQGLKVRDGLQRERYARFAKSLVRAGDAASDNRPLGYRFELVPLSNVWSDEPLRVQALFEGKPLAGLLVAAVTREGKALRARSDAHGVVTFDLPRGVWLVKAVRIAPAPAGSGVEWESLWGSLTFER